MKHGKNPTKNQKRMMAYYRLCYQDWLVTKSTDKELFLVNRHTNAQRVIKKVRIEPDYIYRKKLNKYV